MNFTFMCIFNLNFYSAKILAQNDSNKDDIKNNFRFSSLSTPDNADYYLNMYGGFDDYKIPARKKLYRLIKLDHDLYKRG